MSNYESELEKRCEELEAQVTSLSEELELSKKNDSFADVITDYAKEGHLCMKELQAKIFPWLVRHLSLSQANQWSRLVMKDPMGRIVNKDDPDFKNEDFQIALGCYGSKVELRFGEGLSHSIKFKRTMIRRALFPSYGDKLYKLLTAMYNYKKKEDSPEGELIKKLEKLEQEVELITHA
jgi:hypothetical protein